MNKFRNAELKFLIIPMIIITIFMSLILCFETSKQYKKFSNITNNVIANIIGKINERYPNVDTSEILQILNSDEISVEFQYGKQELLNYGIDINEINSIILTENHMEISVKINVIIMIILSILWIIAIFIYLNRRDKKLKQITRSEEHTSELQSPS